MIPNEPVIDDESILDVCAIQWLARRLLAKTIAKAMTKPLTYGPSLDPMHFQKGESISHVSKACKL